MVVSVRNLISDMDSVHTDGCMTVLVEEEMI